MDVCDGCNQEFYKNELNDCPFCDIEDNKPIYLKYCTNCCIEMLEEGACEGDCGEDFVVEWKIITFKKFFF